MQRSVDGDDTIGKNSRSVSVFFTDDCDLACGHCFIGCPSGYVMDRRGIGKVIKRCLEENISRVNITGGEPMVHRTELDMLLKELFRHGVESALFTNGRWATDMGETEKVMEWLRGRGVVRINCSHDRFRPDDNKECLKRISQVADALGIRFTLTVSGNMGPDLSYLEAQDICHDVRRQIISKFGNANDVEIPLLPAESFRDMPCPEAGKPMVSKGGILFCCGPTCHLGTGSVTCCGHLDTDSIGESIDRARKYIDVLKKNGPVDLAESNNYKLAKASYGSLCEICKEVLEHLRSR